ncbi:MAG TPA: SRPBCC family protein [Gemmatimonadales bacterium]|nr:SRPBCC family protein [Gemmatimonadales bacterium]
MLKKILLGIAILVAAILVLALAKPDRFEVQRAIRIGAASDSIFPYLDDFHNWGQWSPWEKLDPAMSRTFSGPASGVGAEYAWTGNKDVGRGRMEIMESVPSSRLLIALDFLEPFESHNTAEFVLAPAGDSTDVTWTMRGPNLFIGKVMSVFVSMDKLVGSDFESGLANLKAAAER